jgi:hypothetical protein
MAQEHKLPELPESRSEFWKHAEVYFPENEPRQPRGDCEHFFTHRTSQEVICKSCGVGYFLSEGMVVNEGHILHEKTLVI